MNFQFVSFFFQVIISYATTNVFSKIRRSFYRDISWYKQISKTKLNLLQRVRACSHCAICSCDLLLLTMGCIGAGEIVAVTQCEHFHWVLYNPSVATWGIAVAFRKKRTVWTNFKEKSFSHVLLPVTTTLITLAQNQPKRTKMSPTGIILLLFTWSFIKHC